MATVKVLQNHVAADALWRICCCGLLLLWPPGAPASKPEWGEHSERAQPRTPASMARPASGSLAQEPAAPGVAGRASQQLKPCARASRGSFARQPAGAAFCARASSASLAHHPAGPLLRRQRQGQPCAPASGRSLARKPVCRRAHCHICACGGFATPAISATVQDSASCKQVRVGNVNGRCPCRRRRQKPTAP